MLNRWTNFRDETSKRQAGFSLVEMLIAAAILPVVLYAIYSMYETNMTTATLGNKKTELQQNARVALDFMEREIRMAGYNPSCTQNCPNAIQGTSLSATDLCFIAGVNGDNTTEMVRYRFDSGAKTITRSAQPGGTDCNALGTPEVVADDVTSLALAYDAAAPELVRRVTITITASGQAGSKTPTFTFTSDVRLRDL
ncbi:MAG: prepilin-type N-terminal cleavage/methylation domain-containing protein [candidate division NC10 bacterium]|nr:prepilin-type N-terminal cleavage/methylation domain-containing protein [candidate division NC10 bacterium]